MISGFPNSPRLVRGGIVTMDPDTSAILNVLALQYNPDSLSRSMQIQVCPAARTGPASMCCACAAPRSRPSSLKRSSTPPTRSSSLTRSRRGPVGLLPPLAQLESLVNPTVATLQADDQMANNGALEIIPLEQPLTLFVWSKSRVVPVRLTDFSMTEEAFDPSSTRSGRRSAWGSRPQRRRSRLLTPRRHDVHGLPREQGTPGRRRPVPPSACSASRGCHDHILCRP